MKIRCTIQNHQTFHNLTNLCSQQFPRIYKHPSWIIFLQWSFKIRRKKLKNRETRLHHAQSSCASRVVLERQSASRLHVIVAGRRVCLHGKTALGVAAAAAAAVIDGGLIQSACSRRGRVRAFSAWCDDRLSSLSRRVSQAPRLWAYTSRLRSLFSYFSPSLSLSFFCASFYSVAHLIVCRMSLDR